MAEISPAHAPRVITPGQAPLQSDQTTTNVTYDAEYHVWPAAAAGAWMLLAQVGRSARFF